MPLSPLDHDHGHSEAEIAERLANPPGRGHLRDFVYGAIDGGVTTFAIVAGVAGAQLSPAIIIALGLANVLADGFSMAAGNYSGTKAELDEVHRLRRIEEDHIARDPEGERRELRAILAAKGLHGEILEGAVAQISARRETWIDTMLEGEYGLGSVDPHPMRAAIWTFAAFLLAGSVPLVPFILGVPAAFTWSAVATLAVFFAIGSFKARWSLTAWWRSGLETLGIGGAAAALAYAVGHLFA